jgi:hypothetical protein
MRCSLCDRRQADGLLSRGTWGHVHHEGTELHACPTCKQGSDWEDRVRAELSGAPELPAEGFQARPGYPQTAGGF